MDTLLLLVVLETARVGWAATPPAAKEELQDYSAAVAEKFRASEHPLVEASKGMAGLYIFSIAFPDPIPDFQDTAYTLDKVRGLTAVQVVERFGEPHYDTRDAVDDASFRLVYAEPGSIFGWFPTLVFEDGIVVRSYPQYK